MSAWVQISDEALFNLDAYYKIEFFKVDATPKPEWLLILRHPDEDWDEKFSYEDESLWHSDVNKIRSALAGLQ